MTVLSAEFCPRCGESLGSTRFEGRKRRHCETCDEIVFQQPMPAAGVAVVDGRGVLLVRRTGPPHADSWAIPAGVMEHDERPAATAVRELEEETSVAASTEDLTLFDTWQHERPNEGICSVTVGYAIQRSDATGEPAAGSDAGDVRFWRLGEERSGDELRPGERSRMQRAIEAVER
ncbi:NUDIX hydrolase [Halobacteriales archaeon QS_4_69_34]|nr:MAG: NUDIX hydrolase [Halobacteriales archaeon QS_4_69_34]